MTTVYLIGLPGCGKTTLGRMLAQRLGVAFVDLDEHIERRMGMRIPDAFAALGEAAFRDAESAAVADVAGTDAVVATGGGAILRQGNVACMRATGRVVYIDRPVAQIAEDVDTSGRPLLRDGVDALLRLARERAPLYEAAAHVRVDASQGVEQAVEALVHAATGEPTDAENR